MIDGVLSSCLCGVGEFTMDGIDTVTFDALAGIYHCVAVCPACGFHRCHEYTGEAMTVLVQRSRGELVPTDEELLLAEFSNRLDQVGTLEDLEGAWSG
jgi:hypothetical protein